MKFGLVVNKKTENIGDDIQSYAAMRLLPSVDYVIDRENMDTFESNGERVKAIMNGWYMYNKSNWPPSESIDPLWVSVHISKNDYFGIGERFLDGIGGEYLKYYAPIGARDVSTLELLKKKGISVYLSGCLTLTLPKVTETEKTDEVILVDVDPESEQVIRAAYPHQNYVKITHAVDAASYRELSLKERFSGVEALLMRYQNAKCVITSRLHCALPCLALETPVLLIYKGEYAPRMQSFLKLLHYSEAGELKEKILEFDLKHPKENGRDYLETRNNLISVCETFLKSDDKAPKDIPLKDIHLWQKELLNSAEFTFRAEITKQTDWIHQLEAVKEYLADQCEKKDARIAELQQWNGELETGKTYLEERITEKETRIAELQRWNGQLEEGKAHLEDQVSKKNARIEELERWTQQLEEGKAYLEDQVSKKNARIEELEQWCQEVTEGKAYVEEQWHLTEAAWQEAAAEVAESRKRLELLLSDEKIQKIIRKRGYEL